MNLFCIVVLSLGGVAAGACVFAIPLWLMGVPGVSGAYARGWKIGLRVILAYPLAWGGVLTAWLHARRTIEAVHGPILNAAVGVIWLAVLAVTAAVMRHAFRVMSRK